MLRAISRHRRPLREPNAPSARRIDDNYRRNCHGSNLVVFATIPGHLSINAIKYKLYKP